eukprot:8690831-Alexandrium_andersonii.AAC.1
MSSCGSGGACRQGVARCVTLTSDLTRDAQDCSSHASAWANARVEVPANLTRRLTHEAGHHDVLLERRGTKVIKDLKIHDLP